MRETEERILPKFIVDLQSSKLTTNRPISVFTGQSSKIYRKFAKSFELQPYGISALTAYFNNKIYTTKEARNRQKYWWGHLVNSMLGIDPHYVPINGIHLSQLLGFVGKPDELSDIPPGALCAVRIDHAETLLKLLEVELMNRLKNGDQFV